MTLEILNTIFLGIIAFFFLAMTVAIVPLLFKIKGGVQEATALTSDVRMKVDPVMARVRDIADDVEGMTATVRREVDRLGTSAEKVSQRVNELVALAEVVQTEVREPLLKSVATVAGLRRAFGRIF
ncbi:MAG: DUF948 domain-containing protein [Gemmatimonadetes bacterium]|nr:DUF948 domain-containing protein [Gemmatimonadota bacterium]